MSITKMHRAIKHKGEVTTLNELERRGKLEFYTETKEEKTRRIAQDRNSGSKWEISEIAYKSRTE